MAAFGKDRPFWGFDSIAQACLVAPVAQQLSIASGTASTTYLSSRAGTRTSTSTSRMPSSTCVTGSAEVRRAAKEHARCRRHTHLRCTARKPRRHVASRAPRIRSAPDASRAQAAWSRWCSLSRRHPRAGRSSASSSRQPPAPQRSRSPAPRAEGFVLRRAPRCCALCASALLPCPGAYVACWTGAWSHMQRTCLSSAKRLPQVDIDLTGQPSNLPVRPTRR